MKAWKIILITLVASVLTVVSATAAVIYSGAYNVAATSKHWPVTNWVLETALHRSIARQASGIAAPELGGSDQLLAGAANFDAMCSGCHAPPGTQPSVAAQGMYPRPPDLAHAGEEMAANEIYWVLKHGIKASGMPAWGDTHSDEDLWAMTAFVKQWPEMSASDYEQMLASAESSGIGHHADGGSHGQMDATSGTDDGHGGGGGHHSSGGGDGHGEAGHHDEPERPAEDRGDGHTHDDANAHG